MAAAVATAESRQGPVHPLFAKGPPPPSVPTYEDRFSAPRAKQVMGEVLRALLAGAAYAPDAAAAWARDVADEVKAHLKAEPWAQRFKLVVHAVVGEQRGEGCRVAARCFWDQQADGWAQETFSNESIFCVVVAFGCYLY
ncbi:MAG: inner arm dynein light chain [Monoraphidium minutum]|nr:MAG: inner arm dynein light chain [Monoraphidium minutum]